MPLVISSNLVPLPGSPLFVTEDIYVRGGLRLVADQNARDSISPFHKKVGMVVIQQDTGEWFQLQDDLNTWSPVELGGGGSSEPVESFSTVQPLQLSNNILTIDSNRVLPATGTPGHILSKTSSGVEWRELVPGNLARQTRSEVFNTIAPGDTANAVLNIGRTILLLKLSVDIPCKVEGFSTSLYNDSNPYTFIAEEGHLEDDGLSRTLTGEYYHQRRYSILANLEDTVNPNIYWRITNMGVSDIQPILSMSYIPFE